MSNDAYITYKGRAYSRQRWFMEITTGRAARGNKRRKGCTCCCRTDNRQKILRKLHEKDMRNG